VEMTPMAKLPWALGRRAACSPTRFPMTGTSQSGAASLIAASSGAPTFQENQVQPSSAALCLR